MNYSALILVLTYRCNLKCAYCPAYKAEVDMPLETARAAIDKFLLPNDAVKLVRFFGAEPLLARETLLSAARYVREKLPDERNKTLEFQVTTNGTLLDASFLREMEKLAPFRLNVSIDGEPETQRENRISRDNCSADSSAWFERMRAELVKYKPPVTVNMTIAPQNASKLVDNFAWIYKQGMRKFNFLPAYYVKWTKPQLLALAEGFDRLADLIKKMRRSGLNAVIHNMYVNAPDVFFNEALAIDVDAAAYETTAMLAAKPRKFKDALIVGSALDAMPLQKPRMSAEEAAFKAYGAEIVESTKSVDGLLSAFVEKLWRET